MARLQVGTARMKNGTAHAMTGVRACNLALPQGALTSTAQYLETQEGVAVDWHPFQTPRGAPATWPDGSYRFVRIYVLDSIPAQTENDYAIFRNDDAVGDRDWSQHADVTTGVGTVPTTGPQVGAQGASILAMTTGENGSAVTKNLFTDGDDTNWSLEHDGFNAKVWRITWSGASCHNEVVIEFYKDSNHAKVKGRTTYSDPLRTDMTLGLQVRWGPRDVWLIPKRTWQHQTTSTEAYSATNINAVDAGTSVGTYQSPPFTGYLVFGETPTGADLATFNGIKQMRDGNGSGQFPELTLSAGTSFKETGSWGPRGISPGVMPPYDGLSAMAAGAQSVAEQIRDQAYASGDPWADVLTGQTGKTPPGTGGKAGDGIAPYWWWTETNVADVIPALELIAQQEWWRPIAQMESDGSIVDHRDHGDLVVFQGHVFRGTEPNNDSLGKTVDYSPSSHSTGQWSAFDKAHGDIFAQLAYLYMSGCPLTASMIDHQMELLIMEMPTIARWSASSALGNEFLLSKDQERNTRGLRSALWIHFLSPYTVGYTAITQHASEMWNETQLRTRTSPSLADAGNNGGPFPTNSHLPPPTGTNKTWGESIWDEDNTSFETANDGNNLGAGVPANIQWQNAFLVDAALCWQAVDPVAATPMVDMAYEVWKKVVDHSQYFDTVTFDGWHFFNQVFYNDGDPIPYQEMPPNVSYDGSDGLGNNTSIGPGQGAAHPWWRASLQGQANWCMATTQMGLALAVANGDDSGAARARKSINDWHRQERYGSSLVVPSGADAQALAVAVDGLFEDFPLAETSAVVFTTQPKIISPPSCYDLMPWALFTGTIQIGVLAAIDERAYDIGAGIKRESIDRVEFQVTDPDSVVTTVTAAATSLTTPSLYDGGADTGYEVLNWNAAIDTSSFASDGKFTVQATVHTTEGQTEVLNIWEGFANNGGTIVTRTIEVRATGDDANDGITAPVLTLARGVQLSQGSTHDTIDLDPGETYNETDFSAHRNSGGSDGWITIQCSGGTATITGDFGTNTGLGDHKHWRLGGGIDLVECQVSIRNGGTDGFYWLDGCRWYNNTIAGGPFATPQIGMNTARLEGWYATKLETFNHEEFNTAPRMFRWIDQHSFSSDGILKTSSAQDSSGYGYYAHNAVQAGGSHGDMLQTADGGGVFYFQDVRFNDTEFAFIQTSNTGAMVDRMCIESVVFDNRGVGPNSGEGGVTNSNWMEEVQNLLIRHFTIVEQSQRIDPRAWEHNEWLVGNISNQVFADTDVVHLDLVASKTEWNYVMWPGDLTEFVELPGHSQQVASLVASGTPGPGEYKFENRSTSNTHDQQDYRLTPESAGYDAAVGPIYTGRPQGETQMAAWGRTSQGNRLLPIQTSASGDRFFSATGGGCTAAGEVDLAMSSGPVLAAAGGGCVAAGEVDLVIASDVFFAAAGGGCASAGEVQLDFSGGVEFSARGGGTTFTCPVDLDTTTNANAVGLWQAVVASYPPDILIALTNHGGCGSTINHEFGQDAADEMIELFGLIAQVEYDPSNRRYVQVAKQGVMAILEQRYGTSQTAAQVPWDRVFGSDGLLVQLKRTGPRGHRPPQTTRDRDARGRPLRGWSDRESLPPGTLPNRSMDDG